MFQSYFIHVAYVSFQKKVEQFDMVTRKSLMSGYPDQLYICFYLSCGAIGHGLTNNEDLLYRKLFAITDSPVQLCCELGHSLYTNMCFGNI